MTTSERIEHLKLIAEEISAAETAEKQIELLTRGFELFSVETERLDKAYGSLREQFRAVNRKLEETNERLSNKVQELHVLTSYLDSIVSHMGQGLLFIDASGHITTYNQAAEAILEIPRAQALFQPFLDHFKENQFGFSTSEALKTHNAPHIAYTSLSFKDGRHKELEIEISYMPQKVQTSECFDFTQGLILLIRDITEIRRLQIVASRNDRMKALGEMAAQVAHEIRNPLGGIKGFASLLHRDLAHLPEQCRLAEYIVEGTNTLDRLVTQVLNYSRPLQTHFETVNLETLLREVNEALEVEKAFGPRIRLSIQADAAISTPVDPGLFKSALRNLVINSIQAMPNGGKILIRLQESEGKAVIQVIDTGIGIPQEHLKRLFSPFFSTKADGNGLGLAEAHKAVQAHGGELSVDSLPGVGTTFTIKLPIKV